MLKEDLIKIFSYNGADIYDDYAHHPTEIKEVINGVRLVLKTKNSMHFPTSQNIQSK